MKPVSNVYDPVITKGPEVMEWLKKNKPADYQRMQAGEEIGYKLFTGMYKKQLKNKK
jgi:hypothetical protein